MSRTRVNRLIRDMALTVTSVSESVNEQALESQIKTMEENITKMLLRNFKLPSTEEEKSKQL